MASTDISYCFPFKIVNIFSAADRQSNSQIYQPVKFFRLNYLKHCELLQVVPL